MNAATVVLAEPQTPETCAEILADGPDIARFSPLWQEIFQAPGNEPSTSFEWTAAMLQHHLEPADRFLLVRLARGERTLALIPLVARISQVLGRSITVLSPISDRYNTHGDILSLELDDDAAAAFVSFILKVNVRWDIFRMSKLLEENPLLRLLPRAATQEGLACAVRYGKPAYFLPLDDSFEAYLSQRSAKFRNYLKRIAKKLEGSGAGIVSIIDTRGVDDFDRAYGELLKIERASWKHHHGTAISAVARQTGFYREMGRSAAAAGRLSLQRLMLNDVPIAYNLGYIHDGCYYYLKTSYDEAYRSLGAATYLRAKLIDALIARGIKYFDFPGEPYEWESQWTSSVRWHKSLVIYNHTSKGRLLRWIDRLRHSSAGQPTLKHCDPTAIRPSAN